LIRQWPSATSALVQFPPQVLFVYVFMLVAGHITDAFNCKRVLMASLAGNPLAASSLALNSALGGSIRVLYACLFAYQYHRNHRRCQLRTVLGLQMIRAERQADQTRDSQTQRQRSIRVSTVAETLDFVGARSVDVATR